ncbi:MAG: Holliday junction branch migration protein RuvA [Cyclobacteriaceae bacterium]|nr:Holliday junction branch migration protein RuvA [Cyclobacteriaceae bacterium]
MIAYLKGKLVYKDPTHVVVEVNGVGYHVHISLHTFSEVKEREDIRLLTYYHVREDAHILFGFSSEAERQMFQHLISVNGVGPSTAMVVLSYLPPSELQQAILREDAHTLQSVKGIGGKTAQRLILELKDKFRKDPLEEGAIKSTAYNTMRSEALSALQTLGIAKAAAEKSIDAVLKKSGNSLSLEDLVKQALKNA